MEKEQQKAQALLKIEELKRYISNDEIKKEIKLEIKYCDGKICFSSTKTTIKEAVIEAIERGVNLSDANLSGANLSDANLRYANLRGANLSDANLRYANLRYAILIDSTLSGANLRYANLSDANLSGANLRDAILIDSTLSDADLYSADLRGAEMENVKFYGQGGTNVLKKSQITDFLKALGFIIE